MKSGGNQNARCRWRGAYLLGGLPLLAISISLLPLADVSKNFGDDWYNHLWSIEYFGRYIQHHSRPPDILNTRDAIGLASPLFYASKFYALTGLLSIPIGSGLAFRLVAAVLLLAQVYHVRRAAKVVCSDRLFSTILTFAVSAEVFRVISIYERGALTEFVAFALLTMSVCTFLVLLVRIAEGRRDRYGLLSTGLLYSISATIHPLTGAFGGIFLGLLGVVGFGVLRRLKLLIFGLANALGSVLMLGPWLEPVLQFGKSVRIADRNLNFSSFQGLFSTGPFHTLLSGLNPWSFTPFCVPGDRADMYNPHIAWSLPLIVLCLVGLLLSRCFPKSAASANRNLLRSVLAFSYAVGLLCALLYCAPACSSLFGDVFDILQYPIRLVAYLNLCLLLAALCMFGMVDWQRLQACRNWRLWRVNIAVLVILIAMVGLISKVAYVQFVRFSASSGVSGLERFLRMRRWPTRVAGYWVPGSTPRNDAHLDELPATYFCLADYEVISPYQSCAPERRDVPALRVSLGMGPGAGSMVPREIDLAKTTLVVTNVSPFPWNVINLDGRELAAGDLIACPIAYPIREAHPSALALIAGPGHHVLSYQFRPDKYWPFLRDLSWVTLAAWTALSAGVIVSKLLPCKPAAPEPNGFPQLSEPAGELPVRTR